MQMKRTTTKMTKVPFLSEDEIEKEAELLLAEYTETSGAPIKLPIPLDEITIYHLALRLGFADLHRVLRIPKLRDQPDILGAIWVDTETVLIDHSLDPKKHPSMTGRYRFSVAHEIGHWWLHRILCRQGWQPGLIVRGSNSADGGLPLRPGKAPIEWQADFFSSCLLMPRKMIKQAWRDRFGDDYPRIPRRMDRIFVPPNVDDETVADVCSFNQRRDNEALEHIARPFSKQFLVSPVAMRIRLEKLGLLHREVPRQRSFMAQQ